VRGRNGDERDSSARDAVPPALGPEGGALRAEHRLDLAQRPIQRRLHGREAEVPDKHGSVMADWRDSRIPVTGWGCV